MSSTDLDNLSSDMQPGCMWQMGSDTFRFDIITSTFMYKTLLKTAISLDYVRDLCDQSLSDLSPSDILQLAYDRYINVPQKSLTWFDRRSAADGTASSVGKFIRGPKTYPKMEQTLSYWKDKLTEKPFEKTQVMSGHMDWGNKYEDPALLHFAKDHKLCVSQVGTIRVELSLIISLSKIVFKEAFPDISYLTVKDKHLLVSPDGLVSKPTTNLNKNIMSKLHPKQSDLLGMLEIKCISPFHHVETDDKFLEWVDDMETRQWWKPEDIPFVYIIQMCMQALSGVSRYKMNGKTTMWFIRWSPHGYSVFVLPFKYLIRLGIPAAIQYFSLIQRVNHIDQIDTMFSNPCPAELELTKLINSNYRTLMENTTHRYIKIDDYPEFDTYYKATQYFKFKVPTVDTVNLPKKTNNKQNSKAIEVNAAELHECMF
jgi:hypothetical protein